MTTIQIDEQIFQKYPEFRRGVIVATDVNNEGHDPHLAAELKARIAAVREDQAFADYKSHPRVATWRDAFRENGMNPNQNPPSVAGLIKRVRNGRDIAFINNLVAMMNVTSMKYVVPVGGDNLKATTGYLSLSVARGDERYRPLGKPEYPETPAPREIIYLDTIRQEVLCRGWCWRNSHVTRILPSTTSVAINVDALGPVGQSDLEHITEELAAMVADYCGGDQSVYFLSKENRELVCGALYKVSA